MTEGSGFNLLNVQTGDAFSDVSSDLCSTDARFSRGGPTYAVVCGRPADDSILTSRFGRSKSNDLESANIAGRQLHSSSVLHLNAYQRHKKYINDYVLFYQGAGPPKQTAPFKTDIDILRENYRFLPTDEYLDDSTWEKRLVKRYHDKLFKEYCLADMSRYKLGQIGFRWRTEKEVFSGKGQFVCGNKVCGNVENLRSFEVNFKYLEEGEAKNALVKVRLCPECAEKLHYKHAKKYKQRLRQEEKEQERAKKRLKREEEEEEREASGQGKENGEEDSDGEGGWGKNKKTGGEGEGGKEDVAAPTLGSKEWQGPAVVEMEKNKDEEFDEYFKDMFP